MSKIIAVLGPTASGKSKLAIDIAKKFTGEIVNCDSRQIYKYMNIGTAKPGFEEQQIVKHHLFNLVEPDVKFSAGDYANVAVDVIKKIWQKGLVPVLVGGTGFYFSALNEGISSVGKNDEIAANIEETYKNYGLERLLEELKNLDENAYEMIDKSNYRRVARAIEVIKITNKPFAEAKSSSPLPEAEFIPIVVTRPRKLLHEAIEKRTNLMIDSGLEDEVRKLVKKYGEKSPGLNSIGYFEWFDFFNEKISLEQVREKIIIHTRQYAKRQETWFKKRPGSEIFDLSLVISIENITRKIMGKLK